MGLSQIARMLEMMSQMVTLILTLIRTTVMVTRRVTPCLRQSIRAKMRRRMTKFKKKLQKKSDQVSPNWMLLIATQTLKGSWKIRKKAVVPKIGEDSESNKRVGKDLKIETEVQIEEKSMLKTSGSNSQTDRQGIRLQAQSWKTRDEEVIRLEAKNQRKRLKSALQEETNE